VRAGPNGKAPGRWVRPDLKYLLSHYKDVYPGRLHLYNVYTEKIYTISTKQADSEILLVDNATVYYRASDRLYSAPITENGIGEARLLATDEAIRDAHWCTSSIDPIARSSRNGPENDTPRSCVKCNLQLKLSGAVMFTPA
jgi:hypothetical protein